MIISWQIIWSIQNEWSNFEQCFGLWNPNVPTYAATCYHKFWQIMWKMRLRGCELRLGSSGGVTGENVLKTSPKPRKPVPIFRGGPTLILMCPHHAPPTSETRVCYSSDEIFGGWRSRIFDFLTGRCFKLGSKWARSKILENRNFRGVWTK